VVDALSHQLENAEETKKADLYFQRGVEYRVVGEKDKAKADFVSYTELKENDYLGWLELGRLETEKVTKLSYFLKSLEVAQDNAEQSVSCYELTEYFYEAKDWNQALLYCERAIVLDDEKHKKLTPMLLKAHLFWQLGKLDERVDFLKEAKKSNTSVVLRNSWVDAMIDAGRGAEVQGLIEKEIETSRFKSSWRIRAARCEKDVSEAKLLANLAIEEIKLRLDMKQPDVTLLMDLARAYSINEEQKKAIHYLGLARSREHDLWAMAELKGAFSD